MSDETYSFSTTKSRLDEIVSQVRKKDTSLEKSLDLLEEGVRLANACTELIDHADWTAEAATAGEGGAGEQTSEQTGSADVGSDAAVAEDGPTESVASSA
jgi:exodeoxyribonuclease VII small subunit